MGKDFIVHPEVFNVDTIPEILDWLAHQPMSLVANCVNAAGESAAIDVLEIGPGMGHWAVSAAAMDARVHVTAVEINPAALDNVIANAKLHAVEDRLNAGLGDVYKSDVVGDKQFDIIYWDPPFSRGSDALASNSSLERAVWDPAYAGLTQYITDARQHLKPGGRLLMNWSNFFGDGAFLNKLVAENGWSLRQFAEAHYPLGDPTKYVQFLSYELIDESKQSAL
jgi:methylase of polypeptide subunit release factors